MTISVNTLFDRYVSCIKKGDPLAEQLREMLWDICLNLAGPIRGKFTPSNKVNGDLYDDAVKEVFMEFTGPKMDRVEQGRFTGYFLTSVNRRLIDVSRRLKHGQTVSLDALGVDITCDEERPPLDVEAMKARILRIADRLPKDMLETLCLRLEGLSGSGRYEDISERQGIPFGTVKSRLKHVRDRFKPLVEEISQYGPEELEGILDVVPELRAMAERKRGVVGRAV